MVNVMNIKRVKVISVFGIFLISFLCHFTYEWFPNVIFSIIFPVNESIWEHMKIIVTSYLLYGIIDYMLLSKNGIIRNNFLFQLAFVPILGVLFYLIVYLPIYSLIGENMVVSIGLLFLIYIFMAIISYYFLMEENNKVLKIVSIPLIIIVYVIFAYLTYKPPKNYIFYDTVKEIYGIPE